jgi:hypothetical protein
MRQQDQQFFNMTIFNITCCQGVSTGTFLCQGVDTRTLLLYKICGKVSLHFLITGIFCMLVNITSLYIADNVLCMQ